MLDRVAPEDVAAVLRREGYFSVRFGAETGETGADGVLLDGRLVSSEVMLAAQDADSDLILAEWDGSSWGASTQVEDDTGEIKNQPFLFLWDQQAATNEAPVNTVPATQNTAIDTPVVFSTANGNPISVADVDDTPGDVDQHVRSVGEGEPSGDAQVAPGIPVAGMVTTAPGRLM